MSVIGPRPGLWNQDVLTAERDKYGANNVKPGLTGFDGMAEKMKEILNLSKEENMEKGRKAKEYVLKKKSNINQAERVMKWLGY